MIEDLDGSVGRGQWIFMQDGATSHTAKDTYKWLQTKCRFIQGWPANSPDLNPIENLWAIIKAAVEKTKPQTVEDLKKVITLTWNEISQVKINNLVSSFYQRLQLVINNHGESIQTDLKNNISKQNIVVSNVPHDTPLLKNIVTDLIEGNDEQNTYNEGPFSPDEDRIILESFIRYGTKWALITKKLKGRSRSQVKNRFNEIKKSKIDLKFK